MNIGILTHNIHSLSHKRLVDVGTERGHIMHIINISFCYMNIASDHPAIYYRNNENFSTLKAIIPRINREHTYFGTALLRQFERLGVFTLNSSLSITWARDKLRALQHLARHKCPLPLVGVADSPQESEKLIDLVGGAPLVVRLLEGTEGKGTIYTETHSAALSVINAFKQVKSNILVQEYIKEAEGQDIRCIIVGNKIIGSVLRRKNKHLQKGNRTSMEYEPVNITLAEKKIVLQATKAMKLNLAYVDFIRSNRGPLVLDIEPSPNIEAFEKMSQLDIATPILEFIETHFGNTNLE
jgi:ribosomal protein S6--L-glutamate ligase